MKKHNHLYRDTSIDKGHKTNKAVLVDEKTFLGLWAFPVGYALEGFSFLDQ